MLMQSYKSCIKTISLPFPGVEAFCKNLSAVAGTEHFTLGKDEIKLSSDSIIIFGAWHPIYETLLNKIPNKKGVLWTSSAGEMEMTPNGVEILYLNEIFNLLNKGDLDFIIFTDLKLFEVYKQDKIYYLPAPMDLNSAVFPVKPKEDREGISLLTPVKLTKNLFNNLLAVKLIQKEFDIKLYTNLKPYEPIIKSLGLKYQIFDWLPREEYFKIISKMQVNLAVSWCGEYWNYQVMEAGLKGIPSIVSVGATYYPFESLKVGNPDDPVEIADRIRYVLKYFSITLSPKFIHTMIFNQCLKNNWEVMKILNTIINDIK